MAVGRCPFQREDHDRDDRQDRDVADVLLDIGFVDDLAE